MKQFDTITENFYVVKKNQEPRIAVFDKENLANAMLFFDTNEYEETNICMKAKKYYSVKTENISGIFTLWSDCERAVKGVKNAKFKSFSTFVDAVHFLMCDVVMPIKNENPSLPKTPFAFVDGSYNADTKTYGYGVIISANGKITEYTGNGNDAEMSSMRNVAGEILGAQRAIIEAIKENLPEITIYYDYQGIESWATGDWKRNKKYTKEYYEFIQGAKKDIKIKFVKVVAHTGVELNERADRLAKGAVGI